MSIFDSFFGNKHSEIPLFEPKKNARYCDVCAHTFFGYGNVCPQCGRHIPEKIPWDDDVDGVEEDTIEYHASILGVHTTDNLDAIKLAYRMRMKEYHPDKVSALGKKLQRVAEREAKKINRAYDFFAVLHGGRES